MGARGETGGEGVFVSVDEALEVAFRGGDAVEGFGVRSAKDIGRRPALESRGGFWGEEGSVLLGGSVTR